MRMMDSLEECLFRAFANTEYCDPQERSTMWAILEGLMRLKTLDYSWRSVDARKNHECIRGCTIKAGSIYFHRALGAWTWNDESKFCASCMAMILYFKEVASIATLFLYALGSQKSTTCEFDQRGSLGDVDRRGKTNKYLWPATHDPYWKKWLASLMGVRVGDREGAQGSGGSECQKHFAQGYSNCCLSRIKNEFRRGLFFGGTQVPGRGKAPPDCSLPSFIRLQRRFYCLLLR